MTTFLFDAKAAMARITARGVFRPNGAVAAVLAVEQRAKNLEPQKQQEPQRVEAKDGASTATRRPQEPQKPQLPRLSRGSTAEADAIEERADICADDAPALYLDTFARLNHQKPFAVSEAEWRLALDDGRRFLEAWGEYAAALGWTSGDLFDVKSGLVWRLGGERVEALGADHARLSDGQTIERDE